MHYLPIYLLYSFFLRVYLFFRHWYYDGFFWFANHLFSILRNLDRFFALSITARYLFTPLHQDYSLIGYAISIPTRFFLLISGLLIYFFITAIFLLLYLIFAAIPPIIILGSLNQLNPPNLHELF